MGQENLTVEMQYCELPNNVSELDASCSKNREDKRSRLFEKVVHLCSLVTIVLLSHAAVYKQWTIPYFYVFVTPFLILYRVVTYWRCKYQYFLFDYCYYANLILFIYIWIPNSDVLFFLVFGMANGPLIWAMFVYKNSVVFHSIDKVTSSYIHYLPPLLSFAIRWYPEVTLKHWVADYTPPSNIDVDMVVGLLALPFLSFLIHSFLYYIIVQRLFKPSDEYLTSYNYLGLKEEACLYTLFMCCGKQNRCIMYYVFNWMFCLVALTGVMVWYHFYVAHCILLVFQACAIVWNGASYYMHVFAKRGFVDE